MASTPPSSEAFLREVDEELRRDQVKTLWERYGKAAIAVVVAGLVALAAFLGWQYYQRQQAGEAGEQLTQAIDDIAAGKTAEAEKKLQPLTTHGSDGVAAQAKLTQAALALAKNDTKTAVATYAAIAADTNLGKPYRDLALVRQTALEFDMMKPEAVVARLRPLAAPGNPWFGSAGEMVGIAYVKMGRADLAAATFNAIAKDEQVPESIRARVVQLTGAVTAPTPAEAKTK